MGECARGGRRVVQEAVAARSLLPLLPRPVPGRNNLTLLYNDPVEDEWEPVSCYLLSFFMSLSPGNTNYGAALKLKTS